jgi:multiple sugar transport system permease protein
LKKIVLKEKERNLILCLIAIVIGVIFLFPLYWIVISSLKTDVEIFAATPTLIPHNLTFSAYTEQLSGPNNILNAFSNSLLIATISMVLSIVLAVPAAYGLARFPMRMTKIFIMLFLVTQMLPVSLILTPMFLIYKHLGILDSYLAPALSDATISIPFVILILRTYFISLPKELEDSARIDGCNTFMAFMKIMLPLSYPGLVMAAAFSFLFAWGDLAYSLTFISTPEARPMTAGIYNFMGKYGTQWNKIMAYGTLLALPVVAIFVVLQKYIVAGLTNGAVKE